MKKLILLYLTLSLLVLLLSCGENKDIENLLPTPQEIFNAGCCLAPPLEACYKGTHVYIPNVFTPNADGINDLFYVFSGTGISQIIGFTITDQEENTVFENTNFLPNDPGAGWDGSVGEDAPQDDLFHYTVDVEYDDGVIRTYTGQVGAWASINEGCIDNSRKCAFATQHSGTGRMDFHLPPLEACQ